MKLEDWDYWINKIPETEDLNLIEKEKASVALKKIRKFFGSSLPKIAESGHPIWGHYIVNQVAWTRRWFSEFVEAIEMASAQPNGRKVVDKLKNRNQFYNILFELDVGNRFKKSGFDIEFYQKSPESDKIPDLKIKNPDTKEEFFVEITELTSSVQAKEAGQTFDKISRILFSNLRTKNGRRDMLCLCKILKPLSDPHLNEVIAKVKEKIERCKESGFEELIENAIKLAICSEDKREQLKAWGNMHDVHSYLEGPSYHVDETFRLGTKISKKQEQLPKNHLNILVIYDRTAFFLFGQSVEEKINKIEEHVFKHNHLAFCIIVATYNGGMEEKIKVQGEHMYIHKSSGVVDRDILFLSNHYITDKSLTPNSISKIKHAFRDQRNFLL